MKAEQLREYKIEVSNPKHGRSLDMVVAGSESLSAAENQAIFGQYIARLVVRAAQEAYLGGKKLILDAATGSSPKAVWGAVSEMVSAGEADLSNIVVIGHEDAWGPTPKSSTDFDYARKATLRSMGRRVRQIKDVGQVTGEKIDGNIVPMHFVPVRRRDFRKGRLGDEIYATAEKKAAAESAERYTDIVRQLLRREDVKSVGVYGIGTDGHIGEWQISDMGFFMALTRRDAFVQPQEHYAVEAGHFPIGGEPNFYWTRGQNRGEAYGRAKWQPTMGSQEVVVGLGLREMLKLDHVILAFNSSSKSEVFKLAMEGSVDGKIQEDRDDIAILARDKGESEGIWPDLANYGLLLEHAGVIEPRTVHNISTGFDKRGKREKLKCGLLYRKIYAALDRQQATADDPIYAKMGEFALRYVGRRSPLGQFIRMRTLLGKETTIVATPEVVKGTPYEFLAT